MPTLPPSATDLTPALKMARRTLAILEEQAAAYPSLALPATLQIQLEDQRQKVRELEARLGLPGEPAQQGSAAQPDGVVQPDSAAQPGSPAIQDGTKIKQRAGDHAVQVGQAENVTIHTGPVYNIQGGIHTRQNALLGDQVNQISSAGLLQLQQQIAALQAQADLSKAQRRNLSAAQEQVTQAAAEIGKPQPDLRQVMQMLQDAHETLELLAGSMPAAVELETALAELIR